MATWRPFLSGQNDPSPVTIAIRPPVQGRSLCATHDVNMVDHPHRTLDLRRPRGHTQARRRSLKGNIVTVEASKVVSPPNDHRLGKPNHAVTKLIGGPHVGSSSAAGLTVSDAVRKSMTANKSKNTKPELMLRSLVHAMGYRYRVHVRGLPGTPDLVFGPRRKVVWLHGCFWHQHPGCSRATTPRSGKISGVPKLARNRQRDIENEDRLRGMGWQTLIVWECELKDRKPFGVRLCRFLGPTRQSVVTDGGSSIPS